jgi:multiple sugar transport system permease protein
MPENPYINALATALTAVIFIIACCYGLGFLARRIAKARGASQKKQENTFAGYFFAAPWIVGFIIFVIVFSFPFIGLQITGYIQGSANWVS